MTETSIGQGTITQMSPDEARSALSALGHAVNMLRTRAETQSVGGLVSTDAVVDPFEVDLIVFGGLYQIAAWARELLGDLGPFATGMAQVVAAQHSEGDAYQADPQRLAYEQGKQELRSQLGEGTVRVEVVITALDALTALIGSRRAALRIPI
jgi:hypothetical protein